MKTAKARGALLSVVILTLILLPACQEREAAEVTANPPPSIAVVNSTTQTIVNNSEHPTTVSVNETRVQVQQDVRRQTSTNVQVNIAAGGNEPSNIIQVSTPAQTDAQTPALLVGVVTPGPAQGPVSGQVKRYVARSGSKVRIEGTSNIHDWQVEGKLIGGTLEAGRGFPTDPDGARDARANAFISVRSLKSVEKDGTPYSDRMDEVMYECLKSQLHSRIFYSLLSLTPKGGGTTGPPFEFDSVGTLAVAGITNTIEMPITVSLLAENRLQVKGSTAVKMTSFGIEPPSPKWLGSLIKTGDEVKLLFEWTIAEKSEPLASAK